jgi:hypothetical protein
MRIGSRVSKALLDEESGLHAVPNDAAIGTVIAVKTDCDGDGYEFTEGVTVRWDNGIIEDLDLQGDGWELDDVTPLCYAKFTFTIANTVGLKKEDGGTTPTPQ